MSIGLNKATIPRPDNGRKQKTHRKVATVYLFLAFRGQAGLDRSRRRFEEDICNFCHGRVNNLRERDLLDTLVSRYAFTRLRNTAGE